MVFPAQEAHGFDVWRLQLAFRRVDKRPVAASMLEGDLIAAFERQDLTCIGWRSDFES
jgi:hypothetical protein